MSGAKAQGGNDNKLAGLALQVAHAVTGQAAVPPSHREAYFWGGLEDCSVKVPGPLFYKYRRGSFGTHSVMF